MYGRLSGMKSKEELGEKIRNLTPEQRQGVAERAGVSPMTVEGYGNAPKTIPAEIFAILKASVEVVLPRRPGKP